MTNHREYVLGHADAEIQRLQLQASIIGGVTKRLIRECGILPGMSVLDIGCGAGDVSMLLAEAVGPSGRVTAFDREPKAIEAARTRVHAAGYGNIEFAVTTDERIPDTGPYDAAVGRYVLIHQADPAAMLRRVAESVKHGGIIAFHEITFQQPSEFHSLPHVELLAKVSEVLGEAFRATLQHYNIGSRLIDCFESADLPTPHLIWECIADGSTSSLARWLVLSYLSMRPHIDKMGLDHASLGDPRTLAARVESALTEVRAQVVSRPQTCAWVIRP